MECMAEIGQKWKQEMGTDNKILDAQALESARLAGEIMSLEVLRLVAITDEPVESILALMLEQVQQGMLAGMDRVFNR